MKKYVGWVKNRKPTSVPADLGSKEWKFESIVSFSAEDHYVANTGGLLYRDEDWRKLIRGIMGR